MSKQLLEKEDKEEMENGKPDKAKTFIVFCTICMSFTVWGLIISLQPAFYPSEAEAKGATPSEV